MFLFYVLLFSGLIMHIRLIIFMLYSLLCFCMPLKIKNLIFLLPWTLSNSLLPALHYGFTVTLHRAAWNRRFFECFQVHTDRCLIEMTASGTEGRLQKRTCILGGNNQGKPYYSAKPASNGGTLLPVWPPQLNLVSKPSILHVLPVSRNV